jgi:hypothetical protein
MIGTDAIWGALLGIPGEIIFAERNFEHPFKR